VGQDDEAKFRLVVAPVLSNGIEVAKGKKWNTSQSRLVIKPGHLCGVVAVSVKG
jgi:hypothetical protein